MALKKTKNKAAKKAKTKSAAPRAGTIGELAMGLIREGKTNGQALAIVKKKFPGAKTSVGCISWYRVHMRADGEKIPTSRELKAKKAA